jgi:surface carbohydrate biosynthesis protein (TIGR04326 family)
MPDGKYTDPYFGPLPGLLKKRGYKVAFVPRVLFSIPFREAVERLAVTKETMFFPEEFLTDSDIRECRKRMAIYFPEVPDSATIGNIPAASLARENIQETRATLADNLLYEPMIKAMNNRGICPSRIIHTCEGHSWEQALSWSVHNSMPGTPVVGYDNVTFSRLVLSMYPSANEYGKRPVPDRIVTNGSLYKTILIREGVPHGMVSTGCALRHTYLWKENTDRLDLKGERESDTPCRILVATAIGLGDSVELVAKACDAFGGDENYEVLVKCHPLVRPDNVRHFLGEKARFPNVFFDDRPVSALLPKSHILLYTYTSVCFEAMIHGVIPVCVRAENFLNLDKLDAVPDIRWCVTTPMELQKVAKEIQSMPADTRASWQERAYRIVQEALAPPSEECIDAFLA